MDLMPTSLLIRRIPICALIIGAALLLPAPAAHAQAMSERELIARERDRLNNLVMKERKRIEDQMLEKRRAELQLRNQLLEANRRGAGGPTPPQQGPGPATAPPPPPEAPAAPVSSKVPAPVVMMLTPFDRVCRVGDRFVTEVVLFSDKSRTFDKINLQIVYSPLQLRPVQIFDYPIKAALSASSPATSSLGQGMVTYSASFARPQEVQGEKKLLHVVWEALAVASESRMTLTATGPSAASASFGGKNLLVSNRLLGSAVIGALSQIDPAEEPLRGELGIDAKPRPKEARAELRGQGGVKVYLLGPPHTPKPGEQFNIDVIVDNRRHDAFDDLNLAISFDPSRADVLDWDADGWIRRGVNIFDAQAHRAFPFDTFLANSASNETGRIAYHMAASSLRPMGSGSVARIRCVALKDGALESFTLFPKNETKTWFTDIRAGGVSLLREAPAPNAVASTAARK